MFVDLYIYTFMPLCLLIFKYLYICAFVHLSINILPFRKRHCNITFIALIVPSLTTLNYTPMKKSHIAPPILIKSRTITIIARTIVESSLLLLVYF